jgi:hypothetical protein
VLREKSLRLRRMLQLAPPLLSINSGDDRPETKYKSSKMGGVRAVESDVACLLWIGPFASGLANQDRPSSCRTCLHLELHWRRQVIPITFDHAPPSTPARNTRPDCDYCCHQHQLVLYTSCNPPGSSPPCLNYRLVETTPITPRVHPQICILNLCGFHTRCIYGGPRDMPEKMAFSLAALASVHSVRVRVQIVHRGCCTDLPKAPLFKNKNRVLREGI